MDRSAYIDKISSQLNNDMHYNLVTIQPFRIFLKLGSGVRNGSVRKDFPGNSRLGVGDSAQARGCIWKYKERNRLRLITSCCRTAIERISALTEFYLKPLAQKLPSFLKDTTDLINKIDKLNEKGPLPPGTLLVS